MQTAKVQAYAKLNLTLDILGVRDGYHLLDSFVCTVDLKDTVYLKRRKDKLINVYMVGKGSESIPPERNNAVKAGEAFVCKFGTFGADIRILKNIPIGAGLGGSSADIAGVLKGMARLYGVDDFSALKEIADSLGSDSGYLLTGGYARISGRGEIVEPIKSDKKMSFLLLQPKTPVSTAECFSCFDRIGGDGALHTQAFIDAFLDGDSEGMGKNMVNALTYSAAKLNPEVMTAVREAESFSPSGYSMTGAGSGVFLWFEEEELLKWALSRYKGKCRARIIHTVTEKTKKFFSPYALTEEEKNLCEDN